MQQKPTDFTSRVPKYDFGDTLEEQRQQLKNNPLMKRFIESRKRLSDDPHRPAYHFVNPESTLNDPNGLCFWKGYWHLFYQAYPPEDPRQHWGHAISRDLIQWEDLPYAIYPNPEECCFSGTTLVEDDRVIAMYHGTQVGNMVAVSSDPLLLNWEKVTGKAVIPFAAEDEDDWPYVVFDPCLWKQGDVYYALSGGTLDNDPGNKQVAANFLFRSADLENWEYLHPFVEADRFTLVGDDGACPYFWPIGNNKHILLFFSHMSGGQYLLGDYRQDTDKFSVTDHGLFNFGPSRPSGVHAPSATPDGSGGVIVIFNMNEGRPTRGWNQIMTLPRRLTLGEDDELRIEPAGDIESLRQHHQHIGRTALPANQEVVLEQIQGNTLELNLEIDPKNAPMVEVNVLRSPNRDEFTRIAFYRQRGFNYRKRPTNRMALKMRPNTGMMLPQRYESLISIDSSYSSTLPDVLSRAPETAPIFIEDDEPLKLQIFIDRSVVEVFANGKQCLAVRVYPGRGDSLGVSLRAQGQDAELISLDCWQMRSIW